MLLGLTYWRGVLTSNLKIQEFWHRIRLLRYQFKSNVLDDLMMLVEMKNVSRTADQTQNSRWCWVDSYVSATEPTKPA